MARTPSLPLPPAELSGTDFRRTAAGGSDTTVEIASPSDIAREALHQLAVRRIPPTPDNYRTLYHQIAGVAEEETFPSRSLRALTSLLPRDTPDALRIAHRFEAAVASEQWTQLRQVLVELCTARSSSALPWGSMIRELIVELERRQEGLTRARKNESLQHVLAASSTDGEQLFLRLQGLLGSWARRDESEPLETAGLPTETAAAPTQRLSPLIAQLLQRGITPLVAGDATLLEETRDLANAFDQLGDDIPDALVKRLDTFAVRLNWMAEDHNAVRTALLGLLRLLVDNIRELVLDDQWLHGQLSVLAEAFAGSPDIRVLDEVERRLRDVIDKQGQLKRELTDAQHRLKTMLAGFIDRLAEFSDTTSEYHDALGHCAERISTASDISQLTDVVEEMLRETRNAQASAQRSGAELSELRAQVDHANQHILKLQRELDETSELVRHDPLTGALNRKGLDEALAREIARMRRKGNSLCLALLDVDNFKQLNDTFGHTTGDDALRHLSAVVRESLRPHDTVGRYGGEEFLILLPETELEDAQTVLVRLQRELTRRFFLAGEQKLLITFSAGITRLQTQEEAQLAIERADKAMYAAKRAGKNRVLTAA